MDTSAHHTKNTSLQALRFVFVMFIVMSHFSYREVAAFDAGGDGGVAFFFLLSGFAMSMGYGQSIVDGTFSFKRYAKRRLLKVYPLHLLCLAIFLIVFRPVADLRLPINALLLQSWIPDGDYYFSYNGVAWFLSDVLFCYLLFPLVYRHAGRLLLVGLLLACLAVYIVVPYSQINALLYVFPPVRFVDFFLGIMLYKFYVRRQNEPITPYAEPLLVVLLILAVIAYPFADEKFRNAPLFWIVFLPFIYVFAKQQGPVSHMLQRPLFQWLGSLSMPIFMFHPMVFRTLFHFFPAIPSMLMLALALSLTLMVSWATDRLLLQYTNKF